MLRKIFQVLITLLIVIFSFYYTTLGTDIIRNNNPIMKKINIEKYKYEKKYINASIIDDTIIPGVNGIKVDLDKSFNKMFKYGIYNDSLYVFKDVKPSISIDDYYDKYITKGRNSGVALVFTITKNDNVNDILKILNKEKIAATFFVDGVFLENNKDTIIDMISKGYEIELYNYNGEYREVYFKNSLQILSELKQSKNMFCYTSYKDKKVLKLCSKNHLHTVIPTINIKTNTLKTIKDNIDNGSIIKMPKYTNELNISINYIKQRGYKIKRLDELLDE